MSSPDRKPGLPDWQYFGGPWGRVLHIPFPFQLHHWLWRDPVSLRVRDRTHAPTINDQQHQHQYLVGSQHSGRKCYPNRFQQYGTKILPHFRGFQRSDGPCNLLPIPGNLWAQS